MLCCSIRELWMGWHITLSNVKKKPLNSMFISIAYCELGFLPVPLKILQADPELQLFPLVCSFAELVAKILRWSELKINGKDSFTYVHGSGRQRYFGGSSKWGRIIISTLFIFILTTLLMCANYGTDSTQIHSWSCLFTQFHYSNTRFLSLISHLRKALNRLKRQFQKTLLPRVT